MRIFLAALISAVVGTAVGGCLAYIQVRGEASAPEPSVVTQPEPGDQAGPHATVDESEFDFGQMQRGTKKSHQFVFHNVGVEPLTLQAGPTTCKCTLSEVPADPIPPGGSAEVKLEWRALASPGLYRQSAQIKTDDPRHPRFTLTVSGDVTEAAGVWPADFVFGKVRFGEEKSADVYVMSNIAPELHVSDPVFSDPSTGQHLAVEIQPVDPAELPQSTAKAGVRVRVTTKPEMPFGRFDQWLSLKTDLPDAQSLEIPITGRVIGGVSIYGRDWNEDQNVLRLGTVDSSKGAKAELYIIARDKLAAEMATGVKFSVASCDPPELKVTVGKPNRLSDELVSTPVTIEVPAGTPPMVRLNTSQGDEGRIVLHSTLPDTPDLTIKVYFAVQR